MSVQLPYGNFLTSEQIDIINLPTNVDWVINGSAGTGKTMLAIYRAALMHDYKVLLLVSNRPLMMMINTILTKKQYKHCACNTYYNWLNSVYKGHFKLPYPRLERYEPDWNQVKLDFLKLGQIYDHIVIDDAQSLPRGFFNCIKQISKNITCFMDANEAIATGSTNDIKTIIESCIKSPFSLTKNFRNSKEIIEAADLFCDVKTISNCVFSNKKKPVLHECFSIKDLLNKTCDIIEQNQNSSIGIILNNNSVRYWHNAIVDELECRGIYGLVEMYKPVFHNNPLDFTKDDVKIMSFGIAKGLEFDLVLIPRFDRIISCGDDIADRNRIYVAMTRAKEELHLFYITQSSRSNYIDTFSTINPKRQLFTWV